MEECRRLYPVISFCDVSTMAATIIWGLNFIFPEQKVPDIDFYILKWLLVSSCTITYEFLVFFEKQIKTIDLVPDSYQLF